MQKQNYKQKFRWDESFQRRLVGILLTDKHFIAQSINLIKPEYFTNECHSDICKIVLKVAEKYQGSTPDRFIVENYLDELNKDKPDAVKFYYKSELDSIYDYHMANAASREILLDKLVTFAKMQSLRIAMDESQKDMKKDPDSEATWNTIFERFRNVMNVNKSFDVGFEYFQKIDDFFSELNKETTREGVFTSGFLSIDEALSGGGCRRGEIYAFIALAGKGKSLALVKAVNSITITSPIRDIQLGIDLIKKACHQPFRSILENAGVNPDIVLNKINEGAPGYNAKTEEYVDMIDNGIIDPVKVTRTALENAVSIAGLLITTDCLMVQKPQVNSQVQ